MIKIIISKLKRAANYLLKSHYYALICWLYRSNNLHLYSINVCYDAHTACLSDLMSKLPFKRLFVSLVITWLISQIFNHLAADTGIASYLLNGYNLTLDYA